uniref:Uncharacterized protein n=1 Tax=Anguilla anguilla TaxID=7936 RepID=A0A0E9VVL6_ANGAN
MGFRHFVLGPLIISMDNNNSLLS